MAESNRLKRDITATTTEPEDQESRRHLPVATKKTESGPSSLSTSKQKEDQVLKQEQRKVHSNVTPISTDGPSLKKQFCQKEEKLEDLGHRAVARIQDTSLTSSSESDIEDRRNEPNASHGIQPLLSLQIKKRPRAVSALPQTTPRNFTHHLISEHPWAKYVTVRDRPLHLSEDCVTSSLPLEVYRHIPETGYLSNEFEAQSCSPALPIFELMRLQDAIDFRKDSLNIIHQLQDGRYEPFENKGLKTTPQDANENLAFEVAFESVPDAVTVSPSVYQGTLRKFKKDEVVRAETRTNVSTAIRFSESPASVADQLILCNLIRGFIPSHPQEGLLPLKISDIKHEDREWILDRTGRFTNYSKNPRLAHVKLGPLFNVGCSALLAIEGMNDDKCTRRVTAAVPSMTAFPIRFQFDLKVLTVYGWNANRSVLLWIVGASAVVRVSIESSKFDSTEGILSIRLVAPVRSHNTLMKMIKKFSRNAKGKVYVDACVKLTHPFISRNMPVYQIVSRNKLFSNIARNSGCRAEQVLDAVYNHFSRYKHDRIVQPHDGKGEKRLSFNGKHLKLDRDQVSAIRLGCEDHPISLPDKHAPYLSPEEMSTCMRFKKGRELLERYLFAPEEALFLSESEQKEYRLAEKDISTLTSKVVNLMFTKTFHLYRILLPTIENLNRQSFLQH
ncbi:hypothetical protein COOONC_21893 [Cooperia oncophora]